MNEYKVIFTAYIKAENMESVIEKVRDDYGNEVADYANIEKVGK